MIICHYITKKSQEQADTEYLLKNDRFMTKSKLLFEWNNPNGVIDHLKIHLLLPSIGTKRSTSTWSGQDCFWIGLSAPTEVSFSLEEDVDWAVTAQLMGFGIHVHRQWGY